MKEEYPFTFGRMVVDRRHEFFGNLDPSVFLIADPSANEEDGDSEVWVDHYRGHLRIKYSLLRNTDFYKPLGLVDTSKPIHEQLKQAEEDWTTTEEYAQDAKWYEAL